MFQFTPAHDGRQGVEGDAAGEGWFQFTPAHDGRQCRDAASRTRFRFNSRPRTTGDRDVAAMRTRPKVSIHARARRATSRGIDRSTATSFNSRPRTTGDESVLAGGHCDAVSIHARARRATGPKSQAVLRSCFNSRPRTTGDRAR